MAARTARFAGPWRESGGLNACFAWGVRQAPTAAYSPTAASGHCSPLRQVTALYFVWPQRVSGAGRRRSDTPALWRDSSGAEWVGPTGPQDWAVLCRRSAQVTVLCSLAVRRKPWPTWSLRRVEPGQAGNGAAQISRNREFLDRRSEQWLPFCRCAYLDCVAPLCAGCRFEPLARKPERGARRVR